MDRERGKTSESSSLTDQGFPNLMYFAGNSVVEALTWTFVVVESEVAAGVRPSILCQNFMELESA